LKQPDTVFIGGDYWGSWKDGDVGKFKASYRYQAFRVCPWSIDLPLKEIKEFKQYYLKKYQRESYNVTSYIAFRTVMSIADAVQGSDLPNSPNMRAYVLTKFQQVLAQDPNWFRPEIYAVYQVKTDNEKIVDAVFALKGEKNDAT
jgi:hypothetical protein